VYAPEHVASIDRPLDPPSYRASPAHGSPGQDLWPSHVYSPPSSALPTGTPAASVAAGSRASPASANAARASASSARPSPTGSAATDRQKGFLAHTWPLTPSAEKWATVRRLKPQRRRSSEGSAQASASSSSADRREGGALTMEESPRAPPPE
jgi:hypothetical protein